MARGLELDLVEVAPGANPPVCRIMDYGKFKYEEGQKAKEARKKSTNVSVKEVKYRPKIGRGDFDTKTRNVIRFIEEGHKVKITLQFRGREMAHPELGSKILDDVLVAVGPAAKVDTQARLEGRAMSMTLSPDKKAQEAMKKAAAEAEHEGAGFTVAADQDPQQVQAPQVHEGVTDAEDEDVEDRSEAVQEDGDGQAAPRAGDAPAPVREEVVDADASPGG
jgi:translation initiation factor IF-3